MQRFSPILLVMILSLFFVATVSASEPAPTYVHMVVVSATLPDGSSSVNAVGAFEKAVIEMAGGFTRLGSSSGGLLKGATVDHQQNVTFIVAGQKDLSKELKALTLKLFGGDGGFILAWPGTMTY
ncbi:hypothetical protein [uncultured Pseudodesulfovibrio sp.]|uniref:hypothetical protein n=1 Tax=uncultured Pseudodesulfovibrio sp. TaxID=2035858 RepID=UPI0029C9995A|nr:hypothetical protein [uncultured Pseudodesulfovibrio sp.]